jgi:Carboxypeptidase regulatory-like domain
MSISTHPVRGPAHSSVRRIHWLILAAAACLAPVAHAQMEIGTVTGVITDPTYARVANAQVILQNPLTGTSRRETSDEHGRFEFENVAYGSYVLRVDARGFHPAVQSVVVRSNVPLQVAVKLQLMTTKEAVTVRAAPDIVGQDVPRTETVLNQSSIKVGSLVTARNPLQALVATTPG